MACHKDAAAALDADAAAGAPCTLQRAGRRRGGEGGWAAAGGPERGCPAAQPWTAWPGGGSPGGQHRAREPRLRSWCAKGCVVLGLECGTGVPLVAAAIDGVPAPTSRAAAALHLADPALIVDSFRLHCLRRGPKVSCEHLSCAWTSSGSGESSADRATPHTAPGRRQHTCSACSLDTR